MAPLLESCCIEHLNCKQLCLWNRAAGWPGHRTQAQLLQGRLCVVHDAVADASTKCSAEVNWHSPTHFSDVIAVYNGCLPSSGLPGEGRAEHGVWERSGEWSWWSDVLGVVWDGAVWAGGSCVYLQAKAAVGVSAARQSCTIWYLVLFFIQWPFFKSLTQVTSHFTQAPCLSP